MPKFEPREFQDRWRIFLLRRTLVLHRRLGMSYGNLVSFDLPPLPEFIASLLYVDAVALLEDGLSSQMSRTKFDELEDLERRIDYLAAAGNIVDTTALHSVRRRRNDIAHQIARVSVDEVTGAIGIVHRQLEAWKLVPPMAPYEFYAERGAMEGNTGEGEMKRQWKVGVKLDGREVLEYSWWEHLRA